MLVDMVVVCQALPQATFWPFYDIYKKYSLSPEHLTVELHLP